MKKGIFLFLLMSPLVQAENYQIHVLQEGETLSELLESKGYYPLYGEGSWVTKTLEMNHLTSPQDRRLKKGFPVILPSKEAPKPQIQYKNKIVYREKPTSLWSSISKHQDVLFDLSFYQKTFNSNSENLSFRENSSIAFRVEGKNHYRYNQFHYNFNGELRFSTHGNGNYSDDSSISLKPSYELSTDMAVTTVQLPFEFGPSLSIQEQSTAYIQDNDALTRRDRDLFLGYKMSKKVPVYSKRNLYTSIHYRRSLAQVNLTSDEEFTKSTIEAKASLDVTRNYRAGIYFKNSNYEDVELDSDQQVGLNFNYQIF